MGCLEMSVVCIFVYIQCVVFVGSAKLMPYKRDDDKVCTFGARVHRMGVCGKAIPEILQSVCGPSGYLEADEMDKRSPDARTTSPLLDMDAKEVLYLTRKQRSAQSPSSAQLSDVTFNKEDATMFLNKRMDFHQTGIVCECCYNHCSIGEIASYCKDEKDALMRLGIMMYGSGFK